TPWALLTDSALLLFRGSLVTTSASWSRKTTRELHRLKYAGAAEPSPGSPPPPVHAALPPGGAMAGRAAGPEERERPATSFSLKTFLLAFMHASRTIIPTQTQAIRMNPSM